MKWENQVQYLETPPKINTIPPTPTFWINISKKVFFLYFNFCLSDERVMKNLCRYQDLFESCLRSFFWFSAVVFVASLCCFCFIFYRWSQIQAAAQDLNYVARGYHVTWPWFYTSICIWKALAILNTLVHFVCVHYKTICCGLLHEK